MSNMQTHVISCVSYACQWASHCLSIHPSILYRENVHVRCCKQTFEPNSFIHAMPVVSIDVYPFIHTFSDLGHDVGLGNKVNGKQNLLISFSHTFFS